MPARRPPKVTPDRPPLRADLSDRLGAAAAAKKAVLERFMAKADPNDPVVQERQAGLKAISDAREQRAAERRSAREAETARLAAEAAARAAEQAAREAEERRLAAEAIRQASTLEAEQKAARDARYAARKARRR